MDYTVVLQCDKRSGVLIRVTAVLRQHGLQVESQHAATDRRHTCWSISASGSAVAMPEVTQALEHTAGVERVVSFVNGHGGHVEDDSIPVVDELVEPEQELLPTPEQELLPTDEGTFDLPDLDTATDDVVEPQVPVDEFIPDLDIINDIVERFPNIQLAVDKLKARASPEEAESRLIAVGKRVGHIRAQSFTGFPDDPTMSTVLKHFVCPSFLTAATVEADDNGLRVLNSILRQSSSKKRMSLFRAFSKRGFCACGAFFSGYVEGMLNALPLREPVQVKMTLCRNEGEPYCFFSCNTG